MHNVRQLKSTKIVMAMSSLQLLLYRWYTIIFYYHCNHQPVTARKA